MIQGILQEKNIERSAYISRVRSYLGAPIIKVLIGQRRVGKSMILRSIIRDLYQTRAIPQENFFYLDKESPLTDHIRTYEDLKQEFERFQSQIVEGRIFIGIDEVQEIAGWERFVNGYLSLYGDRVEIIITGSNSFLLSGELATYLTGRYIEIPVYPLSFEEWLLFRGVESSREYFLEYLKYGGLPGIFRMEWEETTIFSYLASVYSTIVLRDIVGRYQIRNLAFFQDLYRYTLANIGNIVSAVSISKYLKSQKISIGNDTIVNLLHYSLDTFLLTRVSSVDPDTKQYFQIYNKYYVGDLGLRNALVGYDFTRDIGKLLENAVYLELRRHGYEVQIGRMKGGIEIDFIATRRGIVKYFQVCYLLGGEETMAREYAPLRIVRDNWEKYVVSMDEIDHGISEGIRWIHVMDLITVLEK